MYLYVCTDHDHHWPVGVASLVLAGNENEAIDLLDVQLIQRGLKPYCEKQYTLIKITQTKPVALILQEGNY